MGLNLLSPGFLTSVPCRNLPTSRAGIRKLKPCTLAPEAESDTNCITPTSVASSVTAGPPPLPCVAASARGKQEVEALHIGARGRKRHDLHHTAECGVVGDGRPAAVTVRGGCIRLAEILGDDLPPVFRHEIGRA